MIRKLTRAWIDAPDLRLGQLVVGVLTRRLAGAIEPAGPDLWSVEDDEMERRIDRWNARPDEPMYHPGDLVGTYYVDATGTERCLTCDRISHGEACPECPS